MSLKYEHGQIHLKISENSYTYNSFYLVHLPVTVIVILNIFYEMAILVITSAEKWTVVNIVWKT